MDIVWTKIIVAILFGLLRLIFGLLPIKLYSYLKIWEKGDDGVNHVNKARQKYADNILNMVQAFGGGVLCATCFLHMMPEVYFAVHELEEHFQIHNSYPRSQMVICVGFLMIYFVEDFAQYMIHRVSKLETWVSQSTKSSALNKVTPNVEEKKMEFDFERFQKQVNDEYDKKVCTVSCIDINNCDGKCYKTSEDKNTDDKFSVDSGLDKSNEDLNLPMTERELILEMEKSPTQMIRCCLITMALSFHALFEGIAIGLQHSVSNIWYLFVAISIHSITILFCVGVELLFSHKRTVVKFYFILVLSVTSPIGIMIGLAVTAQAAEESISTAIASALLEGLSAGTLLYITFFEVLQREKERENGRLKRGVCIILGFSVMALLQILQ